jgi:hypothetical protein
VGKVTRSNDTLGELMRVRAEFAEAQQEHSQLQARPYDREAFKRHAIRLRALIEALHALRDRMLHQ